MIAGLLMGQEADGSFGVHPYREWTEAHWQLVSLVELGVPLGHMDSLRAMEGVLAWIGGQSIPKIVSGRERRHASMEGNALFVCCRLGLADNDSVSSLVDTLLRSQWPDGGWNCDERPPRVTHHFMSPSHRFAALLHITRPRMTSPRWRQLAAAPNCFSPIGSSDEAQAAR